MGTLRCRRTRGAGPPAGVRIALPAGAVATGPLVQAQQTPSAVPDLAGIFTGRGGERDGFRMEFAIGDTLVVTGHPARAEGAHVVEHYLNRFLVAHFRIDNLDNARLSFAQKAALLPNRTTAAAFVKPGILQLNRIRNRLCHSLTAELSVQELGAIHTVLDIARPGVEFRNPAEAIEVFTTVTCTFLIVPPPALQQIFAEAFSSVQVRADRPE